MSEIPPLPFPRPSAQSAIIIRRESTVSVTGHWALLWHPTPVKILKLVLTSVVLKISHPWQFPLWMH